MQKHLLSIIVGLSVAVLFGAGCSKTSTQQPGEATAEDKKGLFTTIKDAFNRSVTLRCDYLDENGNNTVTYIKDKKIFLEEDLKTEQAGQKIQTVKGLIVGDKMYMWSDASDKGLTIDFKNPKDGNAPKMGDKEIHSTDDVIGKLEEKKERCKAASVDDSKFDMPKDVQFIEL